MISRRLHRLRLKHLFHNAHDPLFATTPSVSCRRYVQTTVDAKDPALNRTRNIGIIAHIDAGKTTTTERMLYYSGFTRRIGVHTVTVRRKQRIPSALLNSSCVTEDVDEGSTVTDFLPAERARGITIQSAAITFNWPPSTESTSSPAATPGPKSSVSHTINLIDTPGHADFTFEVLRSLRVLDGAICILDGVAGVEAQTEKVWAQASAYSIPRIIFVNKLDRDGAVFGRTVTEIGARLGVWPAVCGIPWWNSNGQLQGIGDVVSLRGLRYAEGGDGKDISFFDLEQLESEDPRLARELKNARIALVELLAEHDDRLVEVYLDADSEHLSISSSDMTESLRRCVLEFPQTVVPVYAGASFRNTGVQPLLDAVVDLLPSPEERPDPEISYGNDQQRGSLASILSGNITTAPTKSGKSSKGIPTTKASLGLQNFEACALAFKVVADARRGVLVYIRVYSGSIARNSLLWNTNLQAPERAQRLLRMYANEAVEIDSISAGHIGVIPGLKAARTGDTLISYAGINPKNGPPAPFNNLQLRPINVPPPVFFVSVEPHSLAEEKQIKESLTVLLREDPSLHVSTDEESGQTHLSGMGELHLEIARDRLINDLKAKARIGSIEIGYREAISSASGEVTEIFDREVSGKGSKAGCTASVFPSNEARPGLAQDGEHHFALQDDNHLTVLTPGLASDGSPLHDTQSDTMNQLGFPNVLIALQNGVSAALARGPNHNYPIHSARVQIELNPTEHLFPNTTLAALSSAARLAVQKSLRQSARLGGSILMEPVMLATISVDEDSMGAVVHDLSSARGGSVVSLGGDGDESATSSRTVDVNRIYAPPDPFAGSAASSQGLTGQNPTRQIVARVPLKEMVGYLKHLRSLTGGRGTFTMLVDRFENMSAQRQRTVLSEMRGEYV